MNIQASGIFSLFSGAEGLDKLQSQLSLDPALSEEFASALVNQIKQIQQLQTSPGAAEQGAFDFSQLQDIAAFFGKQLPNSKIGTGSDIDLDGTLQSLSAVLANLEIDAKSASDKKNISPLTPVILQDDIEADDTTIAAVDLLKESVLDEVDNDVLLAATRWMQDGGAEMTANEGGALGKATAEALLNSNEQGQENDFELPVAVVEKLPELMKAFYQNVIQKDGASVEHSSEISASVQTALEQEGQAADNLPVLDELHALAAAQWRQINQTREQVNIDSSEWKTAADAGQSTLEKTAAQLNMLEAQKKPPELPPEQVKQMFRQMINQLPDQVSKELFEQYASQASVDELKQVVGEIIKPLPEKTLKQLVAQLPLEESANREPPVLNNFAPKAKVETEPENIGQTKTLLANAEDALLNFDKKTLDGDLNPLKMATDAPVEKIGAKSGTELPIPTNQLQASEPKSVQAKAEVLAMTKHFASPQWSQELSERVIWMHKQELPTAQLNLNPKHLGPVSIRVEVNQDQTNVNFSAQHAVVKEAIEAAIPRLKEMFSAQQLTLVEVNVSQHQSEQKSSQNPFLGQGEGRSSGQQAHGELNEQESQAQTATAIIDEIEAGRAISGQGILSIFA